MHKGRNKDSAFKGRRKKLPEYLQVRKFKLRYKDGKFYQNEKEKGFVIEGLDIHDPRKRIELLESLLNNVYIITALPYLRLQYISQGKTKEAADVKELFNKIIITLGKK